MKSRNVLAALIVALASYSGQTAELGKTPIYLDASAQDRIGQTFIFELKEQFRGSSTMQLVQDEESAFHQIRLAIMDMEGRDAIAYSVVWTYRTVDDIPAYSNQMVAICPSSQLIACARSVMAKMDRDIEALTKVFTDAAKEVLEKKQ